MMAFFNKLKDSLKNTRKKLGDNIVKLFHNKKLDSNLIKEIKCQLLTADVSLKTTEKIINNLEKYININPKSNIKNLYNIIQNETLKILNLSHQPLCIENHVPFVLLVIGVNGVGKTTTIGKLANYYKKKNKKIILAAGDTFRFGAIEQLQLIGEKIGCTPVIAHKIGSDPSAVIFDAIYQSKEIHNSDLLIIDTAGRLQNKIQLMKELKKIIQVMQKIDKSLPHEVLIVLDASIGQNSINQIKLFNEIIKITGIFIAKLDGSAKGGALLSISDHFSIPIRYIGIGKNINDIQSFQPKHFIQSIFQKIN